MKLLALKCLNCGAALDFNEGKSYAFCPFCGSKVLLDDETQHIVVSGKVELSGIHSLDRLCQSAETFIGIGDFKNAQQKINEIYFNYPDDYRGYYLGLLLKISSNANLPITVIHLQGAAGNNPYDVSQFSKMIPAMLELCDLTNKSINFAPEEKRVEIKGISKPRLAAYAPLVQDAVNKVETYGRQELFCVQQRNTADQELTNIQDELNAAELKDKHNKKFLIASLSVFVVGFLAVVVHPAFSLLVVLGLLSMLVFGVLKIISGLKTVPIRKRIFAKRNSMLGIRSANGHMDWPDGQASMKQVQDVAMTYNACLNRIS